MRFAITACVAAVMQASIAHSQPVAVELAQTGGYSTENVAAVATQLRLFGEVPAPGLRFTLEAAWAASSAAGSDVFGAAYPYTDRVQVIEAYGEPR